MMPDTVTLQTLAHVRDGQGGLREDWLNVYLDVPARLSQLTGNESHTGMGERTEADYMLTVPYDRNITPGMRVVHRGVIYDVVSVNTAQSIDTARRCRIRRV